MQWYDTRHEDEQDEHNVFNIELDNKKYIDRNKNYYDKRYLIYGLWS